MSIKVVLKDFPKICRLCLAHGELKPIQELKQLELFRLLMDIKVKEEVKMPDNVCLKCIEQLEDIYNFIAKCKINEEALKLVVSKELEKKENVEQEDVVSDGYDNDDVKDEDDFYLKDVKEEIVELEPDILLEINKEVSLLCENCSENFNSVAALNEHYKEFPNCNPKDSKKKEVCNIVEYLKKPKTRRGKKKIKEESDGEVEIVKGRVLKGKRRFLCNYCGKNYTRKNGLERHILSHSGIKPFECKECGKCYITKDTLKTHLLTHTGIKAHKCTVCQKSFTQSSHLSYHMRRHKGEKPHTCTFCGKAFLSSYHLERHKLMHTGVKPYECSLCGKQFVRSTTLRDHMLIHSGEKPFQCQHCGKQFNRKQSLTNHVLVHTGGKNSNSSSANLVSVGVNMSSSENNFKYVNVANDFPVNMLGGDMQNFLTTSELSKETGGIENSLSLHTTH
ncbi:zinc finger and SCAN domain-containing protein 31-like [Diabrotica virgifera virgifera]|uniref:Zinc finger and SCAN domain-containing protein 31-like n=1 Tax=Diabrotica virgifera virgifera TaxID=50390 RepID=A0A6P7FJ00_DIAVI|nr:zinc finger and SCAN domain-containing protein 31-like [Diabrotica virgifera virgifera]